MDEMYAPINEWVHYGTARDKAAVLDAYESLTPQQRAAWDDAVRGAFVEFHGSTAARMYRRLKGENADDTEGMSVTTDDVRGRAKFVAVYDVFADDVLAHHAMTDTPLASKSFGHEREVILRPRNRVSLVGVVRGF